MAKLSRLNAARRAKDRRIMIKATAKKLRAEASKIRNEGKAMRDAILTGEKYKTRRSLGRSAMVASVAESNASAERERNSQNTALWNSIINGTNSSVTDNENTSNNTTDSTTETQHGGR